MFKAESVPEIEDLKSEIVNQGFKMNGPGFFGMEMIIFPIDLYFSIAGSGTLFEQLHYPWN